MEKTEKDRSIVECICVTSCTYAGRRYRPGRREFFEKDAIPKHFKSAAEYDAESERLRMRQPESETDALKERLSELNTIVTNLRAENATLRERLKSEVKPAAAENKAAESPLKSKK